MTQQRRSGKDLLAQTLGQMVANYMREIAENTDALNAAAEREAAKDARIAALEAELAALTSEGKPPGNDDPS